jgi:Intrinsic membrane protein PufX.
MNDSMLKISPKARIGAEIGYLMFRGAAYAAVIIFGGWFLIWALSEIGNFLPEARLDTPDPINRSQLIDEPEQFLARLVAK